jgi:GNAT superfamily N-acetyltransferase
MGAGSLDELIRPVQTDEEVTVAANIIAGAFGGLAATEWLVPEPGERMHRLSAVFAIQVAHAVTSGSAVHLLDQALSGPGSRSAGMGTAIWIDRTREVPEPKEYESRLRSAAGPHVERFLTLDRLFDEHHPTQAHHHLAFLAALPQGTGIGTALLQRYHAHLDAEGIAAYLEASSVDSVHLYRKHGYRLHGDPFGLPNGALFYPMWREPGAGDRA